MPSAFVFVTKPFQRGWAGDTIPVYRPGDNQTTITCCADRGAFDQFPVFKKPCPHLVAGLVKFDNEESSRDNHPGKRLS